MSEGPKPEVKKEVTDFNEIYKNQPADSVIVDGKKESLNLELHNASKQVWLVKLPKFLAGKWNDVEAIAGQEIGKLRINKNQPAMGKNGELKFKLVLNEVYVDPNRKRNGGGGSENNNETSSGDEESDFSTVMKQEGIIKSESPGVIGGIKSESESLSSEGKIDYFKDLPHEYDLRVTNKAVKNQFIFSEQNLDNFAKRQEGATNNDASSSKTSGGGVTKPSVDKKKLSKKQFWREQRKLGGNKFVQFAKAIPKKTALVGTICHECSVTPSINDVNYSNVLQDRKNRVSKRPDKPVIEVLRENTGIIQRFSAPSLKGDTAANDDAFIKANKDSKGKEQNRAIRMERKELLDLLFQLFDEYDYWSMKGLKERVKQPDSWLKECLDSVATLIKRGPYASKYCLKPEYKKMRDVARVERQKELGLDITNPEDENKDDEDADDDVEMETIVGNKD
ncbi:transcription factor IIF subunit [Saccharomycopsis crataegensis]|uniref:Transcription initiation factor IIF subunit beta n=1 Tax=Saccharomycopsis crataegensis TaxID=43959 RepID=A0AAV5QGA9_9ASCO|nr:transcription factor IIF subunit [Saccharomycopsis crataegensis]